MSIFAYDNMIEVLLEKYPGYFLSERHILEGIYPIYVCDNPFNGDVLVIVGNNGILEPDYDLPDYLYDKVEKFLNKTKTMLPKFPTVKLSIEQNFELRKFQDLASKATQEQLVELVVDIMRQKMVYETVCRDLVKQMMQTEFESLNPALKAGKDQ